jgi:DNA excision repair protein ERCC-5
MLPIITLVRCAGRGIQRNFDAQLVTSEPSSSKLGPPATPKSKPTPRTHDSDDGLYESPSRLETVLYIAGAGPLRRPSGNVHDPSPQISFGKASLLTSPKIDLHLIPSDQPSLPGSDKSLDEVLPIPVSQSLEAPDRLTPPAVASIHAAPPQSPSVVQNTEQDSDEDMEEVVVIDDGRAQESPENLTPVNISTPEAVVVANELQSSPPTSFQPPDILDDLVPPSSPVMFASRAPILENDDESAIEWSRSPSPDHGAVPESSGQETSTKPAAAESWDAAQEMDPHAEEGEFARFMSQVKGKDLEAVRHEIDEEIRTLNQQKKAAMRDSEDITQQMISQIMVCIIYLIS